MKNSLSGRNTYNEKVKSSGRVTVYRICDRFCRISGLKPAGSGHRPPEITCDSDTLSISVESEDSELLKGVKAEDNRDGDLTDSVRVSSMSNFTEPGKRTITYAVFDKANNAATMERTLEYTDYTSPKITLTEPLRFDISDMEDASLTEHMKAEDCLTGILLPRSGQRIMTARMFHRPGITT